MIPEDYKFTKDPERFVFQIDGEQDRDPFLRLLPGETSAEDAETLLENEKALEILRRKPGVSQATLAGLLKKRDAGVTEIMGRLFDAGFADYIEGARKAKLWFLVEDRERVERARRH